MGKSTLKIAKYGRRRKYGQQLLILIGLFAFGYLVVLNLVSWDSNNNNNDVQSESDGSEIRRDSVFVRKLLSTNITTTEAATEQSGGEYPPDLFSLEDRRNGAVILHILGMIYMFVALAIVCDEFFVPSLGVITDKLQISEDVAGATFMAAGGSAPELFTSIIGVFLAKNNVGIGTIVGSAVFNILFVIGMCALFSKTVLSLTWWPLFRDVTFYSIGLALLIGFFIDKYIYHYEAAILLLWYVAYVTFMKFNAKIEHWVKSKLNRKVKSQVKNTDRLIVERPQRTCSLPMLKGGGGKFRHGVFQLMIHSIDPLHDGKVHDKARQLQAVTHFKFEATAESDETQNHNDPYLDDREKQLGFTNQSYRDDSEKDVPVQAISNGKLNMNGHAVPSPVRNPSQQTTLTSIESVNRDDLPPLQDRTRSMEQQATGTPGSGSMGHRTPGTSAEERSTGIGGGGVFSPPPYWDAVQLQNSAPQSNGTAAPVHPDATVESEETRSERPVDKSGSTSQSSSTGGSREHVEKDLDDDSEPLDLSWPETWKQRITYILIMPLVFPLWLLLPDVRRPAGKGVLSYEFSLYVGVNEEKRRWYVITFLGSILSIGIFSYFMVWWANQTGETIGFPNEVMGLTILAAGTSVPDLITSVIVAKKGYGDMAVSSSVGSNIFDITVGLPFPWLLYAAIYEGKAVNVNSKGLFCSIIILFIMLMAVIATIAIARWKMSKALGISMFGLYLVFLTFALLLEFEVIPCLVST